MYEVFYLDKVFLFGREALSNSKADYFIDFENNENHWNLIRQFMKDNDSRRCICQASEAKKGLELFSSFFHHVEAAGGLVENDQDEWLLIKRWEMWDLPKGKMEHHENTQEAAVREVSEETGLQDMTIIEKLCNTWHMYERNNRICLKKTHWFRMFAKGKQQLTPQLEEDITQAIWVSKALARGYLKKSYPTLARLVSFMPE